ncbi:MAG TPA: ribonuclease R, partial [Acetobacteraceae bacterium]|nr:ribonuclease R [Acetobacteraceae bacterium]
MVLVTGTDPDGDALARPLRWDDEGPPPRILMAPEPSGRPALAPGDRVLARLRPAGPGRYEGRTISRPPGPPARVLGVFRPGGPKTHKEGRIVPTDRRAKAEWIVPAGQEAGAEPGEIVLAEPIPHHRLGLKPARIIERLGRMGDARAISLISVATHDIPHVFPPAVLAEAAGAGLPPLQGREDLRSVPLV